jgi:hypothetical protein
MPAVVPELAAPVPFVLMGKMFGAPETQLTEFVRSLTVGADANVPMARYWPVPCRLLTVTELGMMESDSRPATPPVLPAGLITVSVPVVETTPVNPFMLAVMVVVPEPTAVATPVELMVATDGALDVHVTLLVTSS